MSGRKRDNGRVYLSGAAKKKGQKEKRQREEELLKKVPKLTVFFDKSVPLVSPAVVSETDFPDKESEKNESAQEEACGNSLSPVSSTDKDCVQNIRNIAESDSPQMYSDDLGQWPFNVNDVMREYWCTQGNVACRHSTSDFSVSRRKYENEISPRYCRASFFTYVHQLTKQKAERTWMCYSPSTGQIFCFPCKLFSTATAFVTEGFNDWKNANMQLVRHEKSKLHQEALLSLLSRQEPQKRVDSSLFIQMQEERAYWRSVLERVTEVVIFLAERGLPFRGSNETVGSSDNGNFLGVMELIAKFDPFLAEHINVHANKGHGHSSLHC
jgi:hypothetical protein